MSVQAPAPFIPSSPPPASNGMTEAWQASAMERAAHVDWQGGAPASSGMASTPAPATHVLASTSSASAAPAAAGWLSDLEREARALLDAGQSDVWDQLTRQFEARLIHTALELTRGRRIEAAQKLGIGRNTITRKIQELGMDE